MKRPDLLSFICWLGVAIIVFGFAWIAINDNHDPYADCDQYANTRLADIPAHCVGRWERGR